MKNNQLAIAGAALLGFVPASTWGAAISVNYDIAGGNTASLAATDTAGAFPATNWNNVQAAGVAQPFNYAIVYNDDGGSATALLISATSGAADTWNTQGTPDEIIFGDKNNMANPTTLTVSNVPYAVYDLYIYCTQFSNETVNFNIGGTTRTLVNTFTPQFNGTDPDFVLNDTYVKFTGLSGTSAVVMDGEIALGGFQIVQSVPEPASALLFGLAGLGLLTRRRA